ncbi:MAG TPA: FHA domain-containing protein [Candidatus Methylacidiphilales bacterium]|nr:FHA domain-containing protein [Candidatus Methylacidiphilales bacterium]
MSLTPSQLAAQPQQPQQQAHLPLPRPGKASAGGRVKRCPSCGLASGVDAFFCPQCGADISLERSEPVASAEPAPRPHPQASAEQAPLTPGAAEAPPLASPIAAGAQGEASPEAPKARTANPVELDKLRAAAAAAIPNPPVRDSAAPGLSPAAAAPTVPPGATRQQPASVACPQCSHENPSYAFLCISCGADMSLAKPPAAAAPVAAAATMPPSQAPTLDRTRRVPPPIPGTLAKSAAAHASGAPPRLQLLIGNKNFDCHDGDILGRAGTLASDLFAPFGTVSRQHASIILQGNRWYIVPSPSGHNATRLDGQELRRGEPTPLTGEHTLGLSTKCEVKLRVVPG